MKDKVYCDKCKRELDWELVELMKNSDKDTLIKTIRALMFELDKVRK